MKNYNLLKNICDYSLAVFLALIAFPLYVIIALLIKITSPGPVFFKQKRVGRNAKFFYIYKFRTMCVDADQLGGYSTQQDDKRIYPFGKFLRKTSLDELPQLLNVLRGDMSFIGPRPDILLQKKNYTPTEWHLRCTVKPGITGLAQVMGRSDLSPEKRKQLDLTYVNNISLSMDMKILAQTLVTILTKKGVN